MSDLKTDLAALRLGPQETAPKRRPWIPLIVLLTLGLLPRCKGLLLAVMWTTKAEGSEKI